MMRTTLRSSRLGRALLILVAVSLPTLAVVATEVATAPPAAAGTTAAPFAFVSGGSGSSCSAGDNTSQNFANWVSSSAAPAGTVAVDFVLTGGGGGGGDNGSNSSPGGAGGKASVMSGRVPASAGQQMWAKLGCGGRNGPSGWAASAAGWAFGGPANNYYSGGGGGASILCQGTSGGCTSGTDVVRAVAGGGGGGGRSANDGCTPVYAGGAGGSGTTGSDVTIAGGTGRAGVDGATTLSNGGVPTGGKGGGGNNTGGAAGNDLWKANNPGAGASTGLSNGFVPTPGGGNGGRGAWGYDSIDGGGGGGGLGGGGGGGGGDTGDGCNAQHAGGAGGGSGSSWFDDSVTGRTWGVAASTVTSACDTGNPFTTLNASTAGYGATDGYSGCPGYVTATWVTSVAPAGAAQTSASATKGTALSIGLTNTDADNDTRTCSIVGSATKGSVTLSGTNNCTASYTASSNTTGNGTFSYQVTDQWNMVSSTYLVTVPIGNRKPVGTTASQTIQRGTSATVNLAATDADGDTIDGTLATTGRLVVSTSGMPSGSTVSCTLAGVCTVTIAANTTPGSYSYTWQAKDLVEASIDVTQTITVANTAPLAPAKTVNNVQRGRPAASAPFNVVGSDPANGDTLTYAVASTAGLPAGSTATCTTAGACEVAVPADTALGNYSLTYTASDGAATSAPATVTVGIGNTAPVANAVSLSTTVGAALAVPLVGTDFNGDTLIYNAPVSGPAKGSVTGSGASRTYTAANGTKGSDSFTYTVSDNAPSTSAAASVSIFINNTKPTAGNQSIEVHAPDPKTFQLTGADVNADALTYFVQSQPSLGDVACSAAGACTYTPDDGAVGADSFTFVAFDGTANSTVATITFDVIPPAPTITGSRSPAPNGSGWNHEAVTVTFSCESDSLASCTAPVTLSSDGAGQSATGTVADTLGRQASTTVSGINVDRTAPSITGLAASLPNAAGWYRTPVTMNWTCSDETSGIAPGACPAASTTVGEGTSVATTASVSDVAGNQASATSQTVQVDQTAPSTGVSSPPTWSKDDVTLSLSASDALSGVAWTQYGVDGGSTQTGTAPVISGQGAHTVSYWSTDAAGNVEEAQSVTVRIDTDAPSITGQRSPAPNGHGWNTTDVDVTFTCGDTGGSSVASCSPTQSFTGEVDTTATGTASDGAGNTASDHVPVRIDRSAPTVTPQVPPANAAGWFNEPVQVSFSCVDTGGSGIDSCPAPVIFGGDGANQAVTGTAYDNAGNSGSASGASVSIDTNAPTISGASLQPANPDGGYFGTVTVHWTCADGTSGVASCPADEQVSGEGVHLVSASVADRAGNTSTAQVTVQINHDPSTDPGMVHGTITDSVTGRPVAGALVRLRTPDQLLLVKYSTVTGTDGTYTLPIVDDGSYWMSVKKDGTHLPMTPTTGGVNTLFTIEHGDNITSDQQLAPGHVLSGTITAASGQPVSGATVRLSSGVNVITDSAGRYEFTGLIPNNFTVTVIAYGYATDTASAKVPAVSTLSRPLTAAPIGGAIKGTVTANTPAGPLAGATVALYLKETKVAVANVTTGTDGRFVFPNLPVGDYQVQAIKKSYPLRWAGGTNSSSTATVAHLNGACATSAASASLPAWDNPCATLMDVLLLRL